MLGPLPLEDKKTKRCQLRRMWRKTSAGPVVLESTRTCASGTTRCCLTARTGVPGDDGSVRRCGRLRSATWAGM